LVAFGKLVHNDELLAHVSCIREETEFFEPATIKMISA